MLTDEEINLIFQGRILSELTREEIEQKEDWYLSKLADELYRENVENYSHSEAWK